MSFSSTTSPDPPEEINASHPSTIASSIHSSLQPDPLPSSRSNPPQSITTNSSPTSKFKNDLEILQTRISTFELLHTKTNTRIDALRDSFAESQSKIAEILETNFQRLNAHSAATNERISNIQFASPPLYPDQMSPPSIAPHVAPSTHPTSSAPSSTPTASTTVPDPHTSSPLNTSPYYISEKDQKLIFPTYSKSNGYRSFKSLCFLEARRNRKYKNIVRRNPLTNELVLNDALTEDENEALYTSTYRALGTHANDFIGPADTATANGITLWQTLDSQLLPSTTSAILNRGLRQEYESITKSSTESLEKYVSRFETKVLDLEHNGVTVGTMREKAIKMITGINQAATYQTLLMKIDDDDNYGTGLTLRQIMMTAKVHGDKHRALNPSSSTPPSNTNTPPPPQPRAPRRPQNHPTGNPTADRPQPSPSPRTPPPASISEMQSTMRNTNNVRRELHAFNRTHRYRCPYHLTNAHNFLQCYHVQHICTEIGSMEALLEVRRSVGVDDPVFRQPPTPNTNRNTPTPRSSPPPAPTPSPNESARLATAVQALRDEFSSRFDSLENNPFGILEHAEYDDDQLTSDNIDDTNIDHNDINEEISPYLPPCTVVTHQSLPSPQKAHRPSSYLIPILNNAHPTNLRHLSSENKVRFAPQTKTITNVIVRAKYVPIPSLFADKLPSKFVRIVIDSGATSDMSSHKSLFETITPFPQSNPPTVLMGDDATALDIAGYGFMNYSVHGKRIRKFGYYVPKLGTTLLSVKQHMKTKGCYFHAEASHSQLAFPSFILYPRVNNEIDMIATPTASLPSTHPIDFNEDLDKYVQVSQPSRVTSVLHDHGVRSYQFISDSKTKFLPNPDDHAQFCETVHLKRLVPQAKLPSRATQGSIGFDVSSITGQTIQPNEIARLPTGLSVSLPSGMYLRLAPRSSLSLQHLTIEGGVIDSDYRGEVMVLMKNNSSHPVTITSQQRVAQFIFERASTPLLRFVKSLPKSTRRGGFGSSNETKTPSRITTKRISNSEVLLMDTSHPQQFRIRKIAAIRPKAFYKTPSFPSHLKMSSALLNGKSPTFLQKEPLSPPSPSAISSINHSIAKVLPLSKETFLQSIGFRNPDNITKHFKTIAKPTIRIQDLPRNPILDPGETATIHSAKKNKLPSTPPLRYGHTWHMDIGFGPCTSIGGIKYTLLLVDKATRYKFVYGLTNLKSSLQDALSQFLLDSNTQPVLIRTDYDTKLMGGKSLRLLKKAGIKVQAAPPKRQHQNGLVERHWQTVVTMARNWLRSSLLPTKYWFYAIKRACEVCNILPTHHLSTVTTPYELVFNEKVDYRQLFPMFSTAYIKQEQESSKKKNKWKTQSLKCIVVGTDSMSDGLLFYHPPSKKTLTCADGYKFDSFSPAGPQFEERFDGGFVFSSLQSQSAIHRPPSHEEGATAYFQLPSQQYIPVTILSVPVNDDSDPYTVQAKDSGSIMEVLAPQLLDNDPSTPPSNHNTSAPFPHLPWIQTGAKVTLYLNDRMTLPKQGTLRCSDGHWMFHPGRSTKNKPIDLPHFDEVAESLVHNKKIFQGWKTQKFVLNARHVRATSNILAHLIVCRKVSASGLHKLESPASLLKHHTLHPEDKATWDAAYKSEYDGLVNIDTWETISEQEYQSMSHLDKGLMPTMAISTIKYDGNGNPTRAKYRIVALGNLDPHQWTKHDCFAPVLSQLELRFLTALAVRKKCIPKTADITQAFCQSSLPENEKYICRPPPGCPITPPGSYWRLKKTLYGLKRSPRHFYELARKLLLKVGMQQHPSSPCLFSGTLIPGQPPLYLGLYVDDFLYFSEDRNVEKHFETSFGAEIDTEFNGQIGYFLGINFNCTRHHDNNVTIHLGQEAFIESLAQSLQLDGPAVNSVKTPYRSGFPVDTIPIDSSDVDLTIIKQMQQYVGCLNWLSISTRPDIATITNLLSRYTVKATSGHIDQIKRVVRYLKGTKSLGIAYSSRSNTPVESHIKFPIPSDKITSLCDANWGPQDQSKPKPNTTQTVELFKSRSLSGFLLWFGGPLHWVSKRQSVTARSSAEAEIYATDECTKSLLHLSFIIEGFNLTDAIMTSPTTIYNDNKACVSWSRNSSTKGLRHLQIRENAVRESVQSGFITVKHIAGKVNLSDMFTKEDKDTAHFLSIRDLVLTDRLDIIS